MRNLNIKNGVIFIVISLLILTMFNSSCATNKMMDIKKQPISTYIVLPYVQPGDIVFFELDNYACKIPGWDHCGIYTGNNEFIHASEYLNCVAKHDISFFEPFDIQIAYGRVITSNYTQRINAVNFAESQIGKPYNSRELKDPNPNSNAWYCSELVWAAYLSQGIDLDRNGWNFPKYVTPLEICWDDDVEMYTYNELNNWYTGFYLSWFINYILNWPINHQF